MAHTLADIPAKLAAERAVRLSQGWTDSDMVNHLAEYEAELRYQAGYPDCSRCGTPDPSVRPYRNLGALCVFCREDEADLRDED